MSGIYHYNGLEAAWYDQLDELSEFEDIDFYQWFAQSGGGPVLDLGCGTGRVMLPLLKQGYEVLGLDSSQEMLDQCSERLAVDGLEAELVQGDMCRFDFGAKRFGTIMVPGFSIQLILKDEELETLLESCRRHLAEDGQLILSTHLPWEMIWDGRAECALEERLVVEGEQPGERLAALQGWRLDTVNQRLHLQNRFERRNANGQVLEHEDKSMTLRWHLPHEMLLRLEKAGFADVSLYGDFSFDPPDEDSESIAYVARLA